MIYLIVRVYNNGYHCLHFKEFYDQDSIKYAISKIENDFDVKTNIITLDKDIIGVHKDNYYIYVYKYDFYDFQKYIFIMVFSDAGQIRITLRDLYEMQTDKYIHKNNNDDDYIIHGWQVIKYYPIPIQTFEKERKAAEIIEKYLFKKDIEFIEGTGYIQYRGRMYQKLLKNVKKFEDKYYNEKII